MILGPAGGKWAFIGKEGKNRIVLPAHTEHASNFVEGLAAIQIVTVVVTWTSREHWLYHPTFLPVMVSRKAWPMYIAKESGNPSTKGHIVLDVPYEQVRPFKDGLASVDEGASGPNQKFGYIDKHGEQIWKSQPSL